MSASKRGDDPEENPEAVWRSLAPTVRVGAIFWLRDSQVVPKSSSRKCHPYAIMGGGPIPGDTARVALGRTVQLSARTSFKPEDHGVMPTTPEEQDEFTFKGGVFSPAGDPPSLDLPGVFLLGQYSTQIRVLASGLFLGWVPKDVIERLTFRARQPLPGLPYPPVGRV